MAAKIDADGAESKILKSGSRFSEKIMLLFGKDHAPGKISKIASCPSDLALSVGDFAHVGLSEKSATFRDHALASVDRAGSCRFGPRAGDADPLSASRPADMRRDGA